VDAAWCTHHTVVTGRASDRPAAPRTHACHAVRDVAAPRGDVAPRTVEEEEERVRDRLLQVLRDFTSDVVNPYDLDELLYRVTRDAVTVLEGAGAGIMLEDDDGRLCFAAASHELVMEVEQVQAHIGDGACHEAFVERQVVVVENLGDEERWPEYTRRVMGQGLHAVLGIPMTAFGQTIGVINVYRADPSRWTEEDIDAAEILATVAAGYVVNASRMRAQHELQEQLHTAIESRDVIGQAKGVLMAREGVSADDAFQMLRSISQSNNIKLREVAQRVVESAAPS
jgi:GAF domain-containing protein